jgi:hypothetical protein
MSALIRHRLHRAFDPTEVDALLSNLYPEGPPPATAVRVNAGCANDFAVAPPVGVLAALPPVPGILGYRLVGLDIVLWDEEALIVIDIVRDALPEPRVWNFVAISSFEVRRLIRESLRNIGVDPADLAEEMESEAPEGWRALVGEPFCWGASGGMPATVLHALPRLPGPLEYRFAGADLVVVNVETGVVMGILHDALRRRAIGARA